jgi:hypothetical protein
MHNFLVLLLTALLTLHATADRATVPRGATITITMPISSPDGAHIELLQNDAYVPLSGGIDPGRCVWNGCVTGPLTLTALASAPDGSFITATVQLDVVAPLVYLPFINA